MPLPLRKRTVHFYEIHLHARGPSSVRRPSTAALPELFQAVRSMTSARNLPAPVGGSRKVRMTLVDWHYDQTNDHYEILLNRADKGVSDVALRDFQTSGLRTAGKTVEEGIEISSHVIVRPNSDGQTALVLLTMGAGLGPGHLERLFRELVKRASTQRRNQQLFNFDNPSGARDASGNPIQYKVRYGFSVHGHQGQTLRQALRTGAFDSMELIARQEAEFDQGGSFKIEERTLKIEPSSPRRITAATISNAVRDFVQRSHDETYDRLRIRFKTPTGQPATTTLAVNDLDAAFTLKERIEFESDVQDQDLALNQTVLEKMRLLLQDVPR